jgi:hypothetical protein
MKLTSTASSSNRTVLRPVSHNITDYLAQLENAEDFCNGIVMLMNNYGKK